MLNSAMNLIKKLTNIIDWSEFEEKSSLRKSKVTIYCSICQKPFHVTIDTIYRKVLKGENYKCMPCAAKEAIKKPEIKKKIITGNIKRSKSTKQRKALSKGQKKRFSNKAQRESMSESLKEFWRKDAQPRKNKSLRSKNGRISSGK